MADLDDLRASVQTLLGGDMTQVPAVELAGIVRQRLAVLEGQLDGGRTFGMTELEHGMLTKLLALLTADTGGAVLH